MIGCLRTRVLKQQIIVLYFEFETVLNFYNLEALDNGTYINALCAGTAAHQHPNRK